MLFTKYKKIMQETILIESPMLDHNNTPKNMAIGASRIVNFIDTNHKLSKKFGADYYHLIDDNGANIYYRHDGVDPKELSYVSKNTQTGVQKGADGNVKHVNNFMRHHIDTNGVLQTADGNTNGSRKLWTNFIKNNRGYEYTVENKLTGEQTPVDHTNIDVISHKIWGDTIDFGPIRIVARK